MKKSGSIKLAERYVTALFDVADKAGALASVEKDLNRLMVAVNEDAELNSILASPLMTREQAENALSAALAKISAHEITQKFVRVLASGKRLPALAEIAQLFAARVATSRGEVAAHVVSAQILPPVELVRIGEALGKMVGKKINLSASVDQSLLGGMVVKVASQQFDGSIAGKLARLEQELKRVA
jgi:F-type H+-transporting ATPase subunit delta